MRFIAWLRIIVLVGIEGWEDKTDHNYSKCVNKNPPGRGIV